MTRAKKPAKVTDLMPYIEKNEQCEIGLDILQNLWRLIRKIRSKNMESEGWDELIVEINRMIQLAKRMELEDEFMQKMEKFKQIISAIKDGRKDISKALEEVQQIHPTNQFLDPA